MPAHAVKTRDNERGREMSEYPEHDKLAAVSDQTQAAGEFIDWLSTQGCAVGRRVADMFVVLEWNQASGQPRVACDDVFDRAADAQLYAADLREETMRVGRRERYTVHELDEED